MRILVAENDTAPASFVKKGLESEHYMVDVSSSLGYCLSLPPKPQVLPYERLGRAMN
jgi:hypothetical protein